MNAAGSPCSSVGPNSTETECFLKAEKLADEKLNLFYEKLRTHLESEDRKRLVVAQRLWIQLRDANCSAEESLYDGGSARPTVSAACIEAMTSQRLSELHTMYDWTFK